LTVQSSQRVTMHYLEIKRLGPLKNTRLELAPLTILTGPPGQGKTYILSALFSELLPADPALVGACFFRGRWGDKLKAAQALYEEHVINVRVEGVSIDTEKGVLRVRRLEVCISLDRGRAKVEKCLEGWLYPRKSRFRLRTGGKKELKLVTRVAKLAEIILERSGFTVRRENGRGKQACLGANNIELPLRRLEDMPEGSFVLSLARSLKEMNAGEREYIEWMFAAALVSRSVARLNESLGRLRRSLDALEQETETVRAAFAEYRPVYAWIGRGLVTLAATEPGLGEAVETESATGLGLGAFLPVYSMARAVREGLRYLDTPRAPSELGLLMELAGPAVIHRVLKERDRLYMEVGDRALPFRLAHGGAVSLVGLILAAAPLLGRGGYLLVDEVEHLLHPRAQAVAALVLLAVAGAGVRVVATTHSTAVTGVAARLARVAREGGKEAAAKEAARLYKVLGHRAPSKEALELVARGAVLGAKVYLVDNGKVEQVESPEEWLPELSDVWVDLAAWASGDTDENQDQS